jgi:hypothetical protein
VNRLSGDIPTTLLDMENISILNGNIFNCDRAYPSTLPRHDPKVTSYECGTDSVNQALFVWVAIVGVIVIVTLAMFALHRFGQVQLKFVVHSGETIRLWMNEIFVRESGLVDIDGESLYLTDTNSIYLYARFLILLQRYGAYMVAIYILLLIPVYNTLSQFQGSYQVTYAWEISAAFLSGMPAGLTLMVTFLFVLTVMYYLYDYCITRALLGKISMYSLVRGIQSMKTFMIFYCLQMSKKNLYKSTHKRFGMQRLLN